MSNHRSKESINLHHSQVSAGRERAAQRSHNRLESFLSRRSIIQSAIREERQAIAWIEFCFFVCISFIAITYTGWAY